MSIRTKVFKNMYQDSVSLMQISAHISGLDGIEQASVVMGTSTNLAQLRDAALDDGCTAGPNDLVIAVRGEIAACRRRARHCERALEQQAGGVEGRRRAPAAACQPRNGGGTAGGIESRLDFGPRRLRRRRGDQGASAGAVGHAFQR